MTARRLLARGLSALLERLEPREEAPSPAGRAEGPALPGTAGETPRARVRLLSAAEGRGEGPALPAAARAPEGSAPRPPAGGGGAFRTGGGYGSLLPREEPERQLARRLRVIRRMGSTASSFGEEVL